MTDTKSPLSTEVASRLLDLLATDDDFRARFLSDREAALASVGAAPDQTGIYCDPITKLASKEAFAAARDALLADLTGKALFMNPHCFIDAKG